MKFQTVLRAQWLAAGLGAALLLTGSAKGQEITNTEFADGQYVVPFSEGVSTQDTPAPQSSRFNPHRLSGLCGLRTVTHFETRGATAVVSDWKQCHLKREVHVERLLSPFGLPSERSWGPALSV